MQETWDKAKYRVEHAVKLEDAPDIYAGGKAYNPYSIRFDFQRAEGVSWGTYTIIYCVRRYSGGGKSIRGGYLHPHQLDEVPTWLSDIIARATPPMEG